MSRLPSAALLAWLPYAATIIGNVLAALAPLLAPTAEARGDDHSLGALASGGDEWRTEEQLYSSNM